MFYILTTLLLSQISHANTTSMSLEEAIGRQEILEIKPVVQNGQHFAVLSSSNERYISAEQNSAAKICGALGYSRVVEQTTEKCDAGEELLDYRNNDGEATYVLQTVDKCFQSSVRTMYRLASVKCAK